MLPPFHGAGAVLAKLARVAAGRWDFRTSSELLAVAGHSAQARLSAFWRTHPMAGGTLRVRRDHAADYAFLRRRTFGFDLAPLPESLALSTADQELNRRAKLVVA